MANPASDDDSPQQRKRPAHLPAFEYSNRAIIQFVTVCTQGRRPLLANPAAHAALLAAWEAAT